MKVSVLQENFSKALNTVSRTIAPKATLPILSNLLLTTDKGRLKLASTNLETGINLWTGAKIEKEGAITIPARALTEFVASLPAGKIDLEVKESTLFLSSNSFKASFTGMAASEFPKIPSFSGRQVLSFESQTLPQVLSQVVFAASSDEGRPVLTGVLLKKEGKGISLVATDGYRLSIKKVAKASSLLKEDLLIPAKTLLEVARVSQETRSDEEEKIKVGLTKEKNQVIFLLPDVELSSRLIEGEFPDFTKIIPTSSTNKASFDKEEFLRAAKIASIFAREQANIVKLKIDPSADGGRVRVSSETPQLGTNESEIEAKVEGDSLEIAFNCRFLLDFLGNMTDEEIILETNDPLSPGVFKGGADPTFVHIIMPVRIQT